MQPLMCAQIQHFSVYFLGLKGLVHGYLERH